MTVTKVESKCAITFRVFGPNKSQLSNQLGHRDLSNYANNRSLKYHNDNWCDTTHFDSEDDSQVFETSVNFNNNPIQNYINPTVIFY